MNSGIASPTRRFDAPPWEPAGRFVDGRGGFSDSMLMKTAIERQPPRYQSPSSGATAGVGSGLTRRGLIYEYIRGHPGVHVRGMAKDLRLATGDLQYHLLWLEKHGFVKTRKSGFYRFVYPTMVFKEEQELLLGILSQETPREILLCLLRDSAMTQGDLARSLGHSQPTISWHMERLVQLGAVSRRRERRGNLYVVAADRGDILKFVKSYYPAVWKRWAGMLSSIVVTAEVKRVDKGGPLQRMT